MQVLLQRGTPSILDASMISVGTPCRPARMISIAKGSMYQTTFAAIISRLGQASVNQRISWPVILVSP